MVADDFKKYWKIFAVGSDHDEVKPLLQNDEDLIYIEAKEDGANTRIAVIDGKLIFGSRTQEIEEGSVNAKNWNRCMAFIHEKTKDKKFPENCILFVENMIKHTMNYNWETIPPCLGFDIQDMTTGKFYDYDKKKEIFDSLDLPMVPLVWRGSVKQFKEEIAKTEGDNDLNKIEKRFIPVCKYAPISNPNQLEEGIVIKNPIAMSYGKIVRNEFKEKNAEEFGGAPKYNKVDDTDNTELVFKYCTNARIDKIIFKLIDSGEKLDTTLMKFLPKLVYEDIVEENWKEILNSNWKLDLKKLRQLVPKRCLAVLKSCCVNNALNKTDVIKE
jgi:hypothetical protein